MFWRNKKERGRLIVFSRWPTPGRAKTRLIPALGAEGAAELQRRMTEHVLARVWRLRNHGIEVQVHYDGGSRNDMRRWLGRGCKFVPQVSGDLGERMFHAVREGLASGAGTVMLIGSDCPELDGELIERAFDSLHGNSLVIGPARDGGYYLFGMRAARKELFSGIEWGSSTVLARTMAISQELGLKAHLLPELSDVDEPRDLPVWNRTREREERVTVIIPTLNESGTLAGTLETARAGEPFEIIVADGGSSDETVRIARDYGVQVIECARGRARQMNAAAGCARGEALLFLHADTQLPARYREALWQALRRPDVVGGAFRFQLREAFPGHRWVERGANWRSRFFGLPYGDQALFARRWAFSEAGGFPEMPIMEDYEFVRRLRKIGKMALLAEPVAVSARRWKRLGYVRTTLVNQLIVVGYACGVSPEKLAWLYRGPSHAAALIPAPARK